MSNLTLSNVHSQITDFFSPVSEEHKQLVLCAHEDVEQDLPAQSQDQRYLQAYAEAQEAKMILAAHSQIEGAL